MGFNLKFSIGFVFATKRLLQMNTAGLFTEVAKRENSASCPHLPTLSGEHTIDGSALPLPRTIHYRFEQDESLTKSATHSENAIKSI